MATMTGYSVRDSNNVIIDADPNGNNVAFACLNCGYPVIATATKIAGVSRGYYAFTGNAKPAECRSCKRCYVISIRRYGVESGIVTVREIECEGTE